NRSPKLLGTQVPGQWINRHNGWRLRQDRSVQNLHPRRGHLPVIAVPARFAAKGNPLPVTKSPRGIGLVEPDAFQAALAAVVHNDANYRPAVTHLAAFDLDNLAVDRLHLDFL